MPKHLGYYADSDVQLEGLIDRFGGYLEKLDRDCKRELQVCLAIYVGRDDVETTSMHEVLDVCPLVEMESDTHDALDILAGTSKRSAQALLLAIATQLASPGGK